MMTCDDHPLLRMWLWQEYRALNEGELVAANISRPEVAELKRWYLAERRRRRRDKHRRMVTGAGWGLYLVW